MGNMFNMDEFVNGVKKASDLIKMQGPDFIFAPVIGAVPLVDILNIVDRKFPNDDIVYMPNSSRFVNRDELMSNWYTNFYNRNEVGQPLKIVCLDEVLSGSSALKGYKQFEKSLHDRALAKAREIGGTGEDVEGFQRKLHKKVKYGIVGFAEKGHKRNSRFNHLINQGLAHVVEFDDIPTIDNVAYNPIRLKVGVKRNGRDTYLPEVDEFVATDTYMSFLQDIASYVGANPNDVQPGNYARIKEGLALSRDDE